MLNPAPKMAWSDLHFTRSTQATLLMRWEMTRAPTSLLPGKVVRNGWVLDLWGRQSQQDFLTECVESEWKKESIMSQPGFSRKQSGCENSYWGVWFQGAEGWVGEVKQGGKESLLLLEAKGCWSHRATWEWHASWTLALLSWALVCPPPPYRSEW